MLIDQVKAKVKDGANRLTDPEDYESAVAAALARYAKDRPRVVAKDLTGSGSRDLELPAEWVPDFSRVTRVEYPVGRRPERFLEDASYGLYQSPDTEVLRLAEDTPAAGETVRVWITVPQTEETVGTLNEDALANLAASVCLRQLAASYGDATDPTLGADVVNYRSKIDEYRRLADALEGRYRAHLGLKEGDTVPAASVSSTTSRPTSWGGGRLTHA